jgi:hypothetical protein
MPTIIMQLQLIQQMEENFKDATKYTTGGNTVTNHYNNFLLLLQY